MITTSKLRKVLELAEKYRYEGAVDWILPFLEVKTEYQKMLEVQGNSLWEDCIESLISLDEEPEIKEHRLELLQVFRENVKERKELENKAKSLDIVHPKETWRRTHSPESKILWEKAGTIPTYELHNNAVDMPIKLSSFNEVGKAIRAGIKVLGKPNFLSVSHKHKMLGWRRNSVVDILELRKALLSAGIRKFLIYHDKVYLRLVIKIPTEFFPESFYKSEDPEVWKQTQEKLEKRKKVREVSTKLDKE